MKNFRSSKNLRTVDPSNKEQSGLRMKVKVLEQQVQLLQKSNLNIFIPLSQHQTKNTPNYDAIISKLKTQILNLQQESQRQKGTIKKLENEKEMTKITHQNQIKGLQERIEEQQKEKEELNEEIQHIGELLDQQKLARGELEREIIEMRVENRFLKEDLATGKKRLLAVQKKYDELHKQVLAVNFHSRIYSSLKVKVTAIQTAQLRGLKDVIEELQRRLRELMQAQRQQKVTLGVKRKDIGQEIVRLKKNIDMQLGLPVNEQSTKAFLDVYKQTNGCFDDLIKACRS